MSEEIEDIEYGYANDEAKQNPFNFGLNAGTTYLKKFEWINNGGKDGAEQQALDIVFVINDTEKSYRKFPVTKAFIKGTNEETTDPKAKEFKEAVSDLNACITHILKPFATDLAIQTALAKGKVKSFKDFCTVAAGILPKNFDSVKLDIFMSYQWQMGAGRTRTYLDIPANMKHGFWLCKAKEGDWKETRLETPADNVREALYYTNAAGEKHPFIRNGWFVKSNFANQQKIASDDDEATGTTAEDEEAGAEAQNADKTEDTTGAAGQDW